MLQNPEVCLANGSDTAPNDALLDLEHSSESRAFGQLGDRLGCRLRGLLSWYGRDRVPVCHFAEYLYEQH